MFRVLFFLFLIQFILLSKCRNESFVSTCLLLYCFFSVFSFLFFFLHLLPPPPPPPQNQQRTGGDGGWGCIILFKRVDFAVWRSDPTKSEVFGVDALF